MPTKPRVEPDLTALRWCRLLEAIRAAVPVAGRSARHLRAVAGVSMPADYSITYYTRAEWLAAVKALRECGAITYKSGIYRRGNMF